MLTEAEAWREIGDAFEARVAEPSLGDYLGSTDMATDGLCYAVDVLDGRWRNYSTPARRNTVVADTSEVMRVKISAEVTSPENRAEGGEAYLKPWTHQPGGAELRATLAYLFAEEAAA